MNNIFLISKLYTFIQLHNHFHALGINLVHLGIGIASRRITGIFTGIQHADKILKQIISDIFLLEDSADIVTY